LSGEDAEFEGGVPLACPFRGQVRVVDFFWGLLGPAPANRFEREEGRMVAPAAGVFCQR